MTLNSLYSMEDHWSTTTKSHLEHPNMGPMSLVGDVQSLETLNTTSLDDSSDEESVSMSSIKPSTQQYVSSGYKIVVGLKEREDVARAAFRTWFRIKPGNKEVKDRWWALYYRKILPKFQLRDNHLGRQINSWIEEELRILESQADSLHLADSVVSDDGVLPTELVLDDRSTLERPAKKHKANSSKEGCSPAYLNVELVHPSPSMQKISKLEKNNFPEGTAEYYCIKLRQHCSDNSIDWDELTLEQDVMWFRENRNQLMESIPSLSGRKMPLPKKKTTTIPQPLNSVSSGDWPKTDMFHVGSNVVVKVDLPGMVPTHDFTVQIYGHRLIVRGERKCDIPEGFGVLQTSRNIGKFEVALELPASVDVFTSEQTLHNGVLTIKFPVREKENCWRTLTVNHVKEDHW